MKKFLIFILCCIAAAALVVMISAGIQLYSMFSEYNAGSSEYKQARDAFFEDINLDDITLSHVVPSIEAASASPENEPEPVNSTCESATATEPLTTSRIADCIPPESITEAVTIPPETEQTTEAEQTSEAETASSSPEPKPEIDSFAAWRTEQKLNVCGIPLDNIIVVRYQMNFSKLQQLSSDIKGWISVENSYIDYPIVQTSDNEFYLRHTITGEWNNCGAIFIDSRNNNPFSEFVTFIYGHNQKNHQMFHDLLKYASEEYWHDYPFISIYTPDTHYTYQIFSAHPAITSDATFSYPFGTEMSPKRKEAWLAAAREASLYQTGISVHTDDRIISLVTCSNEAGTDERFVVHAKLLSAVSTSK